MVVLVRPDGYMSVVEEFSEGSMGMVRAVLNV